MILEIHHETRLEYSDPVIESVSEVRMEPPSDDDQSLRSFRLSVRPAADVARYSDGFGNRVHHFNVLPSCAEVRVIATATVETHPRLRTLAQSQATFLLAPEQIELSAVGFLGMGGPVRSSPALAALVDELRPQPGALIGEFIRSLSSYIRANFEYAKDVTVAHSPVDDVLRQRKGVCQDFTHLMIAILRSLGIPARYVSGYIHRPHKESQSHAWPEIYLPDLGWYGLDPTNDCEINEHFVRVAVGRDFTDVQPNKGVFRGKAKETMSVRVETKVLDRLPSLSWQEPLPTFEVPFTPMASRMVFMQLDPADSQQQQQQ